MGVSGVGRTTLDGEIPDEISKGVAEVSKPKAGVERATQDVKDFDRVRSFPVTTEARTGFTLETGGQAFARLGISTGVVGIETSEAGDDEIISQEGNNTISEAGVDDTISAAGVDETVSE